MKDVEWRSHGGLGRCEVGGKPAEHGKVALSADHAVVVGAVELLPLEAMWWQLSKLSHPHTSRPPAYSCQCGY